MKTKLEFLDLKIGMPIQDDEGNIGIIKRCDDIDSILVNYETGSGGYGFYCIDETDEYHYDPLYSIEE